MRLPEPRRPRHDATRSTPSTRGRVRLRGSLILALVASISLGSAALSCATGGAPRRNGMEAPPPFPVAPDFNIPDSSGAPQSLGSLMGPRGLVLVLYRGHWWPFCRAQLGKLQDHLAEFTALGVHVAAVSADDLEGARTMVERVGVKFPVLSDPKGALLRSYKHWDSEAELGLAGTFVIRPNREIVFYEDDGEKFYRRPSAARVLEVARGL